MGSYILIWIGATAIECLLLCGYVELSPALDVLRWMWILIIGGGIHFFVSHHVLKRGTRLSMAQMTAIFVVALIFRLTVIPLAPSLSDDAYRNIWDGRVQEAGINPYRFAPTDERLAPLRDDAVWPRINHAELKTIYPPTAQLLSRLAAAAATLPGLQERGPMVAWKLTLLLVEMAGGAILAAALYARRRGPAFLIYAWSPLAVVEFYGSGHVDAAGVGLAAAAAGCILFHRRILSGVFFAAAFLTKLIVAPVGIAFLALRGRLTRVSAAVVVAILLALPYAAAGRTAFESLRLYQAEWEFNGVLHRALHVDSWGALPGRLMERRWDRLLHAGSVEEKRMGRLIAVTLVVGGGITAVLLGAAPAGIAVWTLGAFLLIQPTIHPWYLTWLLPFLAVRYVRAFLVWTVTIPFTYEILIAERIGTGWVENPYLQTAAILPVLFFIVWDLLRGDAGVRIVGDATERSDGGGGGETYNV